jgi:hypothetical protein
MPAIVVRNLAPETHRALRRCAMLHGRSAEAEARAHLARRLPTGLASSQSYQSRQREPGAVGRFLQRVPSLRQPRSVPCRKS